MLTNWELRTLLDAQPVVRMRRFAELLGWKGLRLEWLRLRESDFQDGQELVPLIVYYTTSDQKLFIQINTWPHGQTRFHRAAIIAERYGMHPTAWYDFELFDDDEKLRQEAVRLRPDLLRQNFKSRAWRRANADRLLKKYFDDNGLTWPGDGILQQRAK